MESKRVLEEDYVWYTVDSHGEGREIIQEDGWYLVCQLRLEVRRQQHGMFSSQFNKEVVFSAFPPPPGSCSNAMSALAPSKTILHGYEAEARVFAGQSQKKEELLSCE